LQWAAWGGTQGQHATLRYNRHLSEVTGSTALSNAAPAPIVPPKPVVLLILDGWGHRDDPRDNALAQADLPHWRRLWASCPHTLVETSGRHVGLPDGQTLLFAQNSALTRRRWRPWVAISWRHDTTVALLSIR
jgi:hypothetical protein